MTAFRWRFFLAQTVVDFDYLAAAEGDDAAEFFMLYYDDGWRDVYAQHRQEIEVEWQRRNWSKKQKRFVMTTYGTRGFVLAHDRRSDQEMKLWQEWQAREGWKIEPFPEYLERMRKEGSLHE